MDDLSICKCIAEIEGYTFDTGGRYFRCELTKQGKVIGYIDYNPLTDDALCFQLMVKYKIQFMPPRTIPRADGRKAHGATADDLISRSNNPNKAICLAIIETHNGQ